MYCRFGNFLINWFACHDTWYVSHKKIKKNTVLFVKILGKRAILQMLGFYFIQICFFCPGW